MRLKHAVMVFGTPLVVWTICLTLQSTVPYHNTSLALRAQSFSLNLSPDLFSDVVGAARNVSQVHGIILVTVVNDAYLPLLYSWLCNTKEMDIHKTILIITSDSKTKVDLQRDWPEISVVTVEIPIVGGDQLYSHVGYLKIMVWRTEVLNAIVQAGIEILLFEADSVWFANPVPEFQRMKGYDIIVYPVSGKVHLSNGGFLYLYSTKRSRNLWRELTRQMRAFGDRISKLANVKYISEMDNDQEYFSALVRKRFGSIEIKRLPLDIYADGKWYSLPEKTRKQSRPRVILNNWIIGNKRKIDRAKKWNHWFIHEDRTCDMELVRKTVY